VAAEVAVSVDGRDGAIGGDEDVGPFETVELARGDACASALASTEDVVVRAADVEEPTELKGSADGVGRDSTGAHPLPGVDRETESRQEFEVAGRDVAVEVRRTGHGDLLW
jgi:hypothetical protein